MTTRSAGPIAALLAAAVLLGATGPAGADTLEERFQAANGHYFKKRYAEAKTGYLDLIERFEVSNPVVYFNLANTYFQLGELGRAVLNFKRALALDPPAELQRKAKENLEATRKALLDRHRRDLDRSVAVLDETHGALYSIFHLMSQTALAIVLCALWLAFFGLLVARRLTPRAETRRTLRNIAIPTGIVVLIFAVLLAGNALTTEHVVRGVIVEDNVQLREGRHPDAPVTDVPEGLEVRVVDDGDPDETRIRLSNGKEGWVPAATVEKI